MTIRICERAWPAHQAHGDTLGECSGGETACGVRERDDSDAGGRPSCHDDSDSDSAGNGCRDGGDSDGKGADCPEPCATNADCDDGNVCNGKETCHEGRCQAGAPLVCDDGLYCNGVERCDPATGCVPGTSPCEDGVACTIDECNEETHECAHTPADERCDDGNACNGRERCDLLTGCLPGDPIDCGALDSVCGTGACDPATGQCIVIPANEGGSCDDGDDVCTVEDRCVDGTCRGAPVCDPMCERCNAGECISLCGNPHGDDDRISASDALFALRAAVELETCPLCQCDVNGDGKIGSTDALRILARAVRLPVELACVASMTTTTVPGATVLVE
ncbi:MAG: hypothetical protein D6815_00350 [Candidatus Dadabacteria bacterium]|nr:MAG: hypothetical protein D6815_00350 [Candidatus Dadabacteria bacterium]